MWQYMNVSCLSCMCVCTHTHTQQVRGVSFFNECHAVQKNTVVHSMHREIALNYQLYHYSICMFINNHTSNSLARVLYVVTRYSHMCTHTYDSTMIA